MRNEHTHLRRWPAIALAAAALGGAACTQAREDVSGPVNARYDFASCRHTWPTATDPDGGHVGCRDGAYEIGVATQGHPEISRVVYGPAQPRVAMTAHMTAPPLKSAQGLGCWRDTQHGYLFLTATDDPVAILRASSDDIV